MTTAELEQTPRKKRRRHAKKRSWNLLFVLLGTVILLYPVVATIWNDHRLERLAEQYTRNVEAIEPEETLTQYIEDARAYNERLAERGHPPQRDVDGDPDFEDYKKQLNVPQTQGVIARLSIPAIDVDLPVFHTVRSEVLYRGAGHMHGSDLPVGGLGTNAVISAHTGMVDATMFDNLPKLKDGEDVFIDVLGEKLRYRVTGLTGREVVKPEDYSAVTYDPRKDKITLITCTPYGINSDRLLVTAERIALDAEPHNVQEKSYRLAWWMILDLAVIIVVLLVVMVSEIRSASRRRAARSTTSADL